MLGLLCVYIDNDIGDVSKDKKKYIIIIAVVVVVMIIIRGERDTFKP